MSENSWNNLNTLRRFLIELPLNSQFQFSPEIRKDIRKALILAISDNGKYLDCFFPFEGLEEESVAKLDKLNQFDWKLTEYYKSITNDLSRNAYHGNQPCARIFRKGEPVIRCLTCGLDETCALCSHCFNSEYHQGHKVHIAISQLDNGGVCDCGDPEAWTTKDLQCNYSKNTFEDYYDKFNLPQDMMNNFFEVIRILLDYVIDVMSQARLQFIDSDMSSSTIELKSINCTLDPKKYSVDQIGFMDKNSPKYCLMVYNDQIRHYRDAVQRIRLSSKKVKQFAEMVTDKVHKYGKAKVITSSNIDFLKERQQILSATGLATSIRSERDVFREDMCDEILNWIVEFTDSEIFKFNVSIKNLFCRAFLQKWNVGLLLRGDNDVNYQYSVGTLDPNFRIPKIPSLNKPNKSHWFFEASKWDIDEKLCKDCDYNFDDFDYNPETGHLGSRLQYFLYFDIRLWKSIRVNLNDMFNSKIVTNLTYKSVVSAQYFDIYPAIADMFLTIDKEPEYSVMSTMSMQLFTCPSNSTSIINHGGVSRIFSTVYGYLNSEEVKSPSNIEVNQQISMKSLKNGRWSRLFVDMGYLFSKGRDADTILTNNIIPITCDILALFQGKPVMIREHENHIEYESPDYTAFFNTILVIYKFGRSIARCLTSLENEDLILKKTISRNAICFVLDFLLRLENKEYPGLIDEEVDIDFSNRKILKDNVGGNLIWDYNLASEKLSFLHPLHSFLSVLIELSHLEPQEELEEVFQLAIQERVKPDEPSPLTSIFEYPIRTIALAAQIRSGFWVRNGYSVRNQLHLYRNTGLREFGYMRDLFLVQVFVSSCDPNLVCFLIFNRWMLMDGWIADDDSKSPLYDPKILPYMLEECMNFFLHILTEDLYLRGLSAQQVNEKNIVREIIHSLCFGPMNYTNLCSQIPDHITAEKRFEIILSEIANYAAPSGSNDTGVYTLKEQYMEQVNPYYFNYSTNTRDECIKLVKEKTRMKTGKELDEVIIYPAVSDSKDLRVHKYIGNFSTSSYFADFIIRTLQYVSTDNIANADSLIEVTLHLIHVCSLEKSIDCVAHGTFYSVFIQISKQYNLSIAQLLYDLLAQTKFKKYYSKIRCIFTEMGFKYSDLCDTLTRIIPDFNAMNLSLDKLQKLDETEVERKRRIAKERQARLLSKFKKQQSLFLKNNAGNTEYSDIEMDELDDEKGWKFPEAHCILCQNASEDAGPFGIITYIFKSSEFRNIPFDDEYWFLKAFSDCGSLDREEDDHTCDNGCSVCDVKTENWRSFMHNSEGTKVIGPGFSHANQVESKLVSLSCGHGMHFQCYLNYLSNSKNRLSQITRNTPENSEHKEFLCPLCKALNNMFIPILWTSNTRKLKNYLTNDPARGLFDYINQDLIKDEDWVLKFCKATEVDYEKCSELSISYKQIFSTRDVKDSNLQLQFMLLLSDMFQTMSLLTFPQIFKIDCMMLLCNTIKSIEISLRGSESDELIITQLSNNCLINLRVLNEFRNTVLLMKVKNWFSIPNSRSDAYLNIFASVLSLSSQSFNNSILYSDFFESLVSILPIPSFQLSFSTLLKRCFLGHLIQCFSNIVLELSSRNYYQNENYALFDIPTISVVDEKYSAYAAQIFESIRKHQSSVKVDESVQNDPRFGKVILSLLIKACTPFLRRAAILAYVQCAIVEPFDFLDKETMIEADRLCSFLHIKTIGEHLMGFVSNGDELESKIFQKFINSLTVYKDNIDKSLRRKIEYPGIISLCQLPDRLDLFFSNYYYLEKYCYPYTFIEEPAICLYCGDIVDAQKSAIGCKEGQCTTHFLKDCPNTVGIFLLPKARTLLLLHRNGGTFHPLPYLDRHGELPGESKKAKAIYLMKPRYRDFIKNVWLLHNIPNLIVRNLDSVVDAGGWDTL